MLFDKTTWFGQDGPEADVVISSRVRLSRNLSRYLFPGKMSGEQQDEVKRAVNRAFGALEDHDQYQLLSNASALEKKWRSSAITSAKITAWIPPPP